MTWPCGLHGQHDAVRSPLQAFADMDPDGEGSVDITYVLTVSMATSNPQILYSLLPLSNQLLKDTGSDPMQALHPCKMLPGMLYSLYSLSTSQSPIVPPSAGQVDIYVDDKSGLAGAGKRLIKVVLVNGWLRYIC